MRDWEVSLILVAGWVISGCVSRLLSLEAVAYYRSLNVA